MNMMTFLVFLIVTVPAFGLAVLGWLAMEDETDDLFEMVGFTDLRFED